MSEESTKRVIFDCNRCEETRLRRLRSDMQHLQNNKYTTYKNATLAPVEIPIKPLVYFDNLYIMDKLVPEKYQKHIVIYGEFVFNYAAYPTQVPVCDIDIMYFDPGTFNDYIRILVANFGTKKDEISTYKDQLIIECESGGTKFDIRVILSNRDMGIREIKESRDVFKYVYYLYDFYGDFSTNLYLGLMYKGNGRYAETLCNEFIYIDIYNATQKGITVEFIAGFRDYACKPGKVYKSGYGFLFSPLTDLEKRKQEIRDKYYVKYTLADVISIPPKIQELCCFRTKPLKMNLEEFRNLE